MYRNSRRGMEGGQAIWSGGFDIQSHVACDLLCLNM